MDLGLRGKRALITGASRGIGAATAAVLAQEGCDLRLAARGEEDLAKLAAAVSADHGVDVAVHPVDLRDSGDVARLAAAAVDVDILVNNAGDIPGGALADVDEAVWRHGWDLKVFGYVNLTRLVYDQMKERGGGVIVNDIGASGERHDPDFIA
ncbi:SDR family NAD(P)-dependent oxidoreductase, partial [Frankia sp. ACN1ag]|uniref:SDR family NAD(P)-dependent oxidoreductase n=1 Tax=Frankia sp. ACN1ag TaxID=102891 RepID=UPI001F3546C9